MEHFADHNLKGCIAQVQITDRVLSVEEVRAVYDEFDQVTTYGCEVQGTGQPEHGNGMMAEIMMCRKLIGRVVSLTIRVEKFVIIHIYDITYKTYIIRIVHR